MTKEEEKDFEEWTKAAQLYLEDMRIKEDYTPTSPKLCPKTTKWLNELERQIELFKTTPAQKSKIPEYKKAMTRAGLNKYWVSAVSQIAKNDQGIFDLMKLWMKNEDQRHEIVTELHSGLTEYLRPY